MCTGGDNDITNTITCSANALYVLTGHSIRAAFGDDCVLPSTGISFYVPVPVSWPVTAAFFVEMAV